MAQANPSVGKEFSEGSIVLTASGESLSFMQYDRPQFSDVQWLAYALVLELWTVSYRTQMRLFERVPNIP
jgi:hypothetical protein